MRVPKIFQNVTSRAPSKYNINSMVSLYVSTGGLAPAYKYNIYQWFPYMLVLVAWFLLVNIVHINSMVSLYVSTTGLVPAYEYRF